MPILTLGDWSKSICLPCPKHHLPYLNRIHCLRRHHIIVPASPATPKASACCSRDDVTPSFPSVDEHREDMESMRVVHYWPHLFFLESSGPGNSILGWARAIGHLGIETILVGDESAVRVELPRDLDYSFVKHVGRGHFRIPIHLPLSRQGDVLVTHGGWTLTNVVAGMRA